MASITPHPLHVSCDSNLDVKKNSTEWLDRLPTISASEVLRQIRSTGGRTIPTGLDQLDIKLAGTALSSYGRGGLVKGQLTEVFGPPGSGKTALAYVAQIHC